MSAASDMMRKMCKEADDKRDEGLTTPKDIERFDDIVYGEDEEWNVLDVYKPKQETGKNLPVIVSVHGGGWVYGDKERYQYYCMSLAQRGFAVVNFTYRLAPEFKFPAPLEDTNSVITWIFEHGMEYGLDTEHIYIVGDSAGGNDLALYAAICTNPDYAAKFDFHVPENFVPKAIALNCGAYELNGDNPLIADYLPNKGTPEEYAMINPLLYVTAAYPPTFVMTAAGDFLIGEAPKMVKELEEKGVSYVSKCYGDAEHELGHVFHCNMKLPEAAVCNDEECEFFKSWK